MPRNFAVSERWLSPLVLGLCLAAGASLAQSVEPPAGGRGETQALAAATPGHAEDAAGGETVMGGAQTSVPPAAADPAPTPIKAGEPSGLPDSLPASATLTVPPPVGATPAAVPAPAVLSNSAVALAPDAEPAVTIVMGRLTSDAATGDSVLRPATKDERAALTAFYAGNGGRPLWTTSSGFSPRGAAAHAELRQADAYGLNAGAFDLPADSATGATPQAQAEAELKIGVAALTYARHARGGRVDPASISRLIDMRPTFAAPKTVLEALAASDDAGAALRAFHPQHVGFRRLQQALVAARATTTPPETIQRILVNMERWRWMPDDLGSLYVMNNVPEQMTRVVKGGETVLTERIVVGKPSSPTPMFSANMQFVIFHPSWGVPEGIKANELGPMLRRASASGDGGWFWESGSRAGAALARHNLRVMHNGREVNPDTVDWSRVNVREFQFTQPPSGRNVLGVVKFRFPNRHDVYMHDTPERHLFNAGLRAFSHGCMRVQNPMHLAEVLLANDKGWSKDKVNGFVGRGATADITLDKPVPVHNTYFTASADESGKLHVHGDLYGMDSRVASALTGKSVHLAAHMPATAAAPRRTAATRVPTRSVQRKAVQASSNPFAGLFSN